MDVIDIVLHQVDTVISQPKQYRYTRSPNACGRGSRMGWFQQVSDAVDQIRWTGILSIAEDDGSRVHNQGWFSGRREIPGILRERPVDLVLHAK